MATLNTQVSIVDYLNSKQQDSSFGARTTLAKQYGIADYGGTAEQNTLLLSKLQQPAPSPVISQFQTSPAVATSDPLRNAELLKQTEQQQRDQEEEQQLLRLQRQSAIKQLSETTAPTRPDLVGTYNTLRSQNGIADLETELSDTRKQSLELKASLTKAKNDLNGQGNAQGVVNAATNEETRKVQEQLEKLGIQEQTIVDQLNMKNSVIETMINLTGKDYANAKDEYDTKFSQAIQTINTIRGIQEADKSAEERAQDNARANLQILANQLSSGDLQFSQLDPAQQAQISKLELQAGLPIGTIARIKDSNPKSDIVSTTTRVDPSGNTYTDIVLRDKITGALSVQSIGSGKSRLPASSTTGTSDDFKFTQTQLQKASATANIPLADLNKLPGEVINVFTSGQYDVLKKQVLNDLEDFISPSEIEKQISEEPGLPDAVKDALVRYLKSQASRFQ